MAWAHQLRYCSQVTLGLSCQGWSLRSKGTFIHSPNRKLCMKQQDALTPLGDREPYLPPSVSIFLVRAGISLLESASVEGRVVDYEDGDDIEM